MTIEFTETCHVAADYRPGGDIRDDIRSRLPAAPRRLSDFPTHERPPIATGAAWAAEYFAQKRIRAEFGIRTRTTVQMWKPEFDGLHWVRDVAPLCGITLPDPVAPTRTRRVEQEWVHEFRGGRAVSYPADSPDGQRVLAVLAEAKTRATKISAERLADRADRSRRTEQRRDATNRRAIRRGAADGFDPATGLRRGVCAAPRALFPNRTCGAEFWGPKGQTCCSDACAARLRRANKRAEMGGDARGDNRGDIRMPLPGAPRAVSGVAVAENEAGELDEDDGVRG